jgi:hypothetical protein
MKKTLIAALLSIFVLNACGPNDAQVASANLSQAADNFQINRRIVFYNTHTDAYVLEIQGLCSIDKGDSVEREITVTCKTGPDQFKKHFLGMSRDLTFFAEQLDSAPVSVYNYKVTFKPSAIIPSIEVK